MRPHPNVSAHAAEQIATRFGVNPTSVQWNRAIDDIVEGRAVLLSAVNHYHSRPTASYLVQVSGIAVPVVFDTANHTIVTVLPRGFSLQRKLRPVKRQGRKAYTRTERFASAYE
jgi:hypothetical protein